MSGSGLGSLGVPLLFIALTVIEAGIPLPIPGDVLMLLVGERAAADAVPLWVAIVGLELVVIVGAATPFFATRGPLRGAVTRLGPRVGLTPARLERVTGALEHRGQAAVAIGRATPSLRTLTVIAAAASRLSARRAIAWLVLGGSVFVQLHLALGYLIGPVAEQAFKNAAGPALAVVAVLSLAGLAYWLRRRGPERGAHAWSEATCPACIALAMSAVERRVTEGPEPHP